MNDRIFIVAGNYEQYKEWVRKNIDQFYAKDTSISLSNFVYVHSADTFRGHREVHGYYIGTYNDRPDIEQIRKSIHIINHR